MKTHKTTMAKHIGIIFVVILKRPAKHNGCQHNHHSCWWDTACIVHYGDEGGGREKRGKEEVVMLLTWMVAMKPGVSMEINNLAKSSDPYRPILVSLAWDQVKSFFGMGERLFWIL